MTDTDSITAVAGIDTISVCWSDADLAKVLHLHASLRDHGLGPAKVKRGQMGASIAIHRDVLVGAYRVSPDMVFIEGRLASLLGAGDDPTALASLGDLAALPLAIAQHLHELGVSEADADLPFGPGIEVGEIRPVDTGALRVRRIDLAVDLAAGGSGRDVLEVAAGVRVPGRASAQWRNADSVSLALSTERSKAILARIYDRAHATGEPTGHTIRLERQKRWTGDRRPAFDDVARHFAAEATWREEFDSWLPISPAASGSDIGIERVYRALRDGKISAAVAERLLGTLGAISRGETLWSADGGRRRRARLARLGIVAGEPTAREVDFAAIRAAIARAWESAHAPRLTREASTA